MPPGVVTTLYMNVYELDQVHTHKNVFIQWSFIHSTQIHWWLPSFTLTKTVFANSTQLPVPLFSLPPICLFVCPRPTAIIQGIRQISIFPVQNRPCVNGEGGNPYNTGQPGPPFPIISKIVVTIQSGVTCSFLRETYVQGWLCIPVGGESSMILYTCAQG